MYKYLPKNYEIVEDQKPTGVTKFKFIKILKEDEDYIDGDKVKERAKESKGFYGMSELEYIFEHQDLVPNDVGYIIFPATVLRDPSGSLYVPYLYRNGGRLVVAFCWLGYDWFGRGRFAVSEEEILIKNRSIKLILSEIKEKIAEIENQI